MSTNKHESLLDKCSPAPWVRDRELGDGDIVACDELMATVYPMKRDGRHQSWEANAELITKAPAMLKAIEAWHEHWDNRYDGEPLKDYELQMLHVLGRSQF